MVRIDVQEVRKALARKSFFDYCQLTTPKFYKPSRQYLIDLCDDMQEFLTDDNDILVVNVPPRHGKSLTSTKFTQWLLGLDHTKRVMTGSYNETLSTNFSKQVRNAISEVKAQEDIIVYSDIFPGTKIKFGDGAMNMWSLEGSPTVNYLATSPTGTATGFGADFIIIDDLIKSAEEANNANVLEKHWSWFTDTMLSRLEEGGKLLIIMTRWHSKDLAGRVLTDLSREYKIKHINLKAKQDDGTMLCEEVLSAREFNRKTKSMSPEIAAANYQQSPIDVEGALYSGFKTYTGELPEFKQIRSYTDTADTGADFLATYIYGVTFDNEAYILDVLFTKDAMEITEPALAAKLYENKVNFAKFESNNGGRGFARSVERILNRQFNSNYTVINWFHQTKNKIARILTHASWCMEHIYFPEGWHNKWPELYEQLMSFQKEGKNKHDDAPDSLTGVAEDVSQFIVDDGDVEEEYDILRRGFGFL
ncbi:phage terminase large subunit [Facklamia sp. P12955]|uniref:phage terminase large subunit n=1 Tax=Facklamia sp. P12955 TaxID=3421946 RepID=UPI003D186CA7